MWLRSTVALKHASFVLLYASGLDVLRGLVPQWLRTRYRLLFLLRVGAHFPLEQLWAISGVSWGASGTYWGGFWGASGTSWGGFWELRGRLGRLLGAPRASGDASGCFGGASGRLLSASRASQRGSWELPRRPGERPGVLLGRLGKPFEAPRELWERKRRKSENHCFT